MVNTWLALKQMTEALNLGRLEEALALGMQPGVKEHQRGHELLKQLGIAFLERAKIALGRQQVAAAWKDTEYAGQAGAETKLVERFRHETAETAKKTARTWLEQGPAQRALDQIAALRQQGLKLPELSDQEIVAKAWLAAQELAERGEFGLAIAKLDAVEWQPYPAIAAFHAALMEQQFAFTEKNAELQLALEDRRWRDVIRLADQLIVLAPHNAPVRRARGLAWKELEPPTLVPAAPAKAAGGSVALLEPPPQAAPAPEPAPTPSLPRRFLLWIDGIGGFLVCLSAKVSLGQASEGTVDLPLFADISRLHAYITRDSEGYLLEALRPSSVNGKPIDKVLLKDGDQIGLGNACRLAFHQPVAITNTGRIEVQSRHKLPLSLDGVILMDETLLLGNTVDAHITVPFLRRPLALLRRRDELIAQTAMPFEIDGKPQKNRGVLRMDSCVTGEDFRISLEPIGPQFGRVRI